MISRWMARYGGRLASLALLLSAGGPVAAQEGIAPGVCTVTERTALPEMLRESSGLARSVRDSALFWTHNDGSAARLFALDASGAMRGSVTVPGVQLEDLEDLASARCDGEPCLLLADIGDNDASRDHIAIHEVREPEPGQDAELLRTLRLRYPDGPRDAEALLVTVAGERYIISKGRHGPVTLFRVPATVGTDSIGLLEPVRELAPEPEDERDRVTAASASPDGKWVAVRTYHTLRLYDADAVVTGGASVAEYDITAANESQGEGVVLGASGAVWLSTEAEQVGTEAALARLTCSFPTTQ